MTSNLMVSQDVMLHDVMITNDPVMSPFCLGYLSCVQFRQLSGLVVSITAEMT